MSDEALTTSSPEADADWPAKATQTVVGYVDTVRTATTGKALIASRAVVYFLALGLVAMMTVVILLVLVIRALVSLTSYLHFIDSGEVWLAYLILGGLFLLGGMLLWRKKEA